MRCTTLSTVFTRVARVSTRTYSKSTTRKKFSELPSVALSPQGEALPPLQPWPDPSIPVKRLRKTRATKTTLGLSEFNVETGSTTKTTRVDEATPDVPPKIKLPRKRASKKTEALVARDPEEEYRPNTDLARGIFDNLAKYPNCILFTRVGNFYESYFTQAREVASLLSIKLTTRSWGGRRVDMCGFPLVHLDRHLKRIVQEHHRFVAMCEEFKLPEGGFTRRVTRIITPGTLVDETFVNQSDNNFLLAISEPVGGGKSQPIGVAWIDVSSGDFFFQQTTISALHDDLVRLSPREVVLHKALEDQPNHAIRLLLTEESTVVSYSSQEGTLDGISQITSNTDDITPEQPHSTNYTDAESSAIMLLSHFLRSNLMEYMPRKISAPVRHSLVSRMQIDANTIRSLEIKEGLREGGATGSLLSVLKRTVTTSGTRLLARWICSPSASIPEINARQSLVAIFHDNPHFCQDLVSLLRRIEDTARIVQRFLIGKGTTDDFCAITTTIEAWRLIKSRVGLERNLQSPGLVQGEWASLDTLMNKMVDLHQLGEKIALAVDETETGDKTLSVDELGLPEDEAIPTDSDDLALKFSTTWRIRPSFSTRLTTLHEELHLLWAQKTELETRLQRELAAPSLTLRSSPRWGFHVHIAHPRRDLTRIKDEATFVSLASSASTKLFFNQTWFILASSISSAEAAICIEEKAAFDSLRNEVTAHAGALRQNARIIDEIDVTIGFAKLASELKFVRPTMTDEAIYDVVNGRHPTVERGLLNSGRQFTPNTISLKPSSRLQIITGPNMAGKSTVLRQTALISILAQTGSFVPAERATIGVVDRVFSRIGARDDLFRDRSTFMVEMLETAEILQRATERSLVIMDEIGRGTTVKDGLAIAFATVEYLYRVNGCRALFATHFHELGDILGYSEETHMGTNGFRNIGFFCTDVDESEEGHISYAHKLRPGVNRQSHGLKVAMLAGMPQPLLKTASDVLRFIQEKGTGLTASELKALGESIGRTPPP